MTQRDKTLARMRQNPKNVRFEEIDGLLLAYGFAKRQRGSHAVYALGEHRVTIPFRRPFVLPVYVKQVIEILEQMEDAA